MIEIHIADLRDRPFFGYESEVVPRVGEEVYHAETGSLYRVVRVQHIVNTKLPSGGVRQSFVHCHTEKL